MSLTFLKFKNAEDYSAAAVVHGEVLEEQGWRPDPETDVTMYFPTDAKERIVEVKRRLTLKGIEFEEGTE